MKEETFQLTAQKCQWSKRLLRALCANGQDDFEETDRFLEAHNLPRPNREETENPNRPIARKEVERLLKNVLIQKSLGAGDFIGAPWQTFKEGWTPTLLKPFKKKKKKEEGTLPDSVYKASTTLTLKPNKIKKTKQNHKKTQLQVSIPNEHRCENPQQNASKQFPNTRKGPDSTECELSNVTNHINWKIKIVWSSQMMC